MKNTPLFILTPIAALLLNGCSDAPAATETATKTLRPIHVIELGTSDSTTKRFSGVLKAADTANLAFKVPGTILEVLVKNGDSVKEGQVLARLDPHDYNVAKMELDARLEEANAAHALAKIELERVKQATSDNAIAQVNLDRATSGYKRSLAMVKVVKQNLQKANDAIAYTELKAPFDGIVGKQFSEQFEQAAPGLPMFTIHQPNHLEAIIDVPENLVHQFTSTSSAQVSWYGSKALVAASLKETSTLPDPLKQTYTMTFSIDNNDANLLPGKAVKLDVALGQQGNQYCIPYSAIVDEDNNPSVFVIRSGKARQTNVTIDTIRANDVCVNGRLNKGDRIVTAGSHYLTSGQAVGEMLIDAVL